MNACLACGRKDAALLSGWEDRLGLAATDRLRRCAGCGLAWLERPATSPGASYEDTYFNDYAQATMPGGIDSVPPHVDERLDDLKRLLGGPGKFLDIGCGYGNVLHAAREAGWQAEGLDISRWGAEHVKRTRGIHVTVGDAFSVDFGPNAFDAIHLSHSLEHMPEPRGVLARIQQWLRPGGVVLIEVPNQLDELYANVRWALLHRYVERPVANSHEFFFTSGSLQRMLEATGYQVITLRTERRAIDVDSRIPLGGMVKRMMYDMERRLRRGPDIVAWARRQ